VSAFEFKAPPPQAPVAPAARRPTFAIVIASYQAAATVGASIESALAQTLPADEVIVVDDGSTDGTEAVLASFGDRITAIRQPNGGEASAKTAGARAAVSDFVVILDADDLYLPERIEAIAELAVARPDLDVIATDTAIESEGREIGLQSQLHAFPLDAQAQRDEILRHTFFWVPAIRRERLLALGGFDTAIKVGTDWDCFIRLVLDGCLVGRVEAPLYRYQLQGGSLAAELARKHHANVTILARALADPRLSERERAIVREGIAVHRQAGALADAREALLGRRADARRAALRVVTGRGFSPPSRAKAALSALSPALARRLLERRPEAAHSLSTDVEQRVAP
jgi:hypothetical protein